MSESVSRSRRAYERLRASSDVLAEPRHTYFNAESGGFVVTHRGHMTEGLDSEMKTARFYAERGVWVRLLDETGSGPSAGAHHGGPQGDGLRWDYKAAGAEGNTKGQAQRAVSAGKRPSGNVVIRFEQAGTNIDLLNRGVKAALLHDRGRAQPLVKNIVVLYPTPLGLFEEKRTSEVFLDGRLFRGPS